MLSTIVIDIFLNQISFITDNKDLGLGIRVAFNLLKPAFDGFISGGCIEIVHEYNTDGVLIICAGDGSKGLLSSLVYDMSYCIPDLYFNDFVFDLDFFSCELNAHSWV
jgi:hypothetical protein